MPIQMKITLRTSAIEFACFVSFRFVLAFISHFLLNSFQSVRLTIWVLEKSIGKLRFTRFIQEIRLILMSSKLYVS